MIIIPARLDSTRFPRKVLHPIDGVPMVVRTARQALLVDDVVIATDSQEVYQIAESYGLKSVLTSPSHKSGTDRVNEAATILGLDEKEIVINVQADEPFIEPDVIESVKDLTKKFGEEAMLCSAYKEIPFMPKNDPNQVKVVLDSANFALYFSRSLIPYPANGKEFLNIHLGIYGYTKKMLDRFCRLEQAPLEKIEKLEQLRALFHGYDIAMSKVESNSVGIDTPEDLERLSL